VRRLGERLRTDTYVSLYSAEPETVLAYVQEVEGDPRSVLVVGHNPTRVALAFELLAAASPGREHLGAHGLSTCSLAVVDLPIGTWEEAAEASGTLVGLFAPPTEGRRPATVELTGRPADPEAGTRAPAATTWCVRCAVLGQRVRSTAASPGRTTAQTDGGGAAAPALELEQGGEGHAGAGHADRVAHCDGATVDVDDAGADPE